eukprot:3465650-Rhodomonas_salina.1
MSDGAATVYVRARALLDPDVGEGGGGLHLVDVAGAVEVAEVLEETEVQEHLFLHRRFESRGETKPSLHVPPPCVCVSGLVQVQVLHRTGGLPLAPGGL